jgi:hypothetical protein
MYLRFTDLSTMVYMIYPGLWPGRFNHGRPGPKTCCHKIDLNPKALFVSPFE